MTKRSKVSFNPTKFLAKVGDGKTMLKYRKNQLVFSQGDAADAVFYIQAATRLVVQVRRSPARRLDQSLVEALTNVVRP